MNLKEYKRFRKNTLYLDSNSLDFKYDIERAYLYLDIVIVFLCIPHENKENSNVFAFKTDGDYLWQIKPYREGMENCPYIGLAERSDGKTIVFNWCDRGFTIDLKTGELSEEYYTK